MKISENIRGLDHLGLPTPDLEKTIAFYEGLGFSVAWRTQPGAAEGKVAFLRRGDVVLEAKARGYSLMDREIRFLPFWDKGVRFFNVLGPSGETVEFLQKL